MIFYETDVMLNEMGAEFVASDHHDFTVHFFVLKSLVFEIPEKADRRADVDARKAAEAAIPDDYGCIWYQGDYTKELIDETDYPSFDVEGACQAFKAWKGHKVADIMTFRNNAYASVITGTMAPMHHTPWKDALDDSMDVYLQN